jgi:hypothetical protein
MTASADRRASTTAIPGSMHDRHALGPGRLQLDPPAPGPSCIDRRISEVDARSSWSGLAEQVPT